jgi:hypothetical protein
MRLLSRCPASLEPRRRTEPSNQALRSAQGELFSGCPTFPTSGGRLHGRRGATTSWRGASGSTTRISSPTGYAASDEFALADGTKVTSDVRTYATEAEALNALTKLWRRLRHALDSGTADDCVTPLLPKDEDFHSEIQVGWYQFDPYRPPADYFDSWRITVRVRGVSGPAKGSSATAFVDLHIQQQGNTSAAIRTQRARRPFDPGVQEDLLQAVTERMSE